MRRAAKVDANQKVIVSYLRQIGAEVQTLHTIGQGCPDLLVAFRGRWYVVEIKDGDKSLSRQKLTPDELVWHDRFNRVAEVHIWTSLDDALSAMGSV